MDLVSKLPLTRRKVDSLWVIVDLPIKSAHFLPVQEILRLDQLAQLFVDEFVLLYEVPIGVISDRHLHFVSRFWKDFQIGIGTRSSFSTDSFPQMDRHVWEDFSGLEGHVSPLHYSTLWNLRWVPTFFKVRSQWRSPFYLGTCHCSKLFTGKCSIFRCVGRKLANELLRIRSLWIGPISN